MLETQPLDFIYEGGVSKRYHTLETLKEQNIAEHSFGVAWLCEILTQGNARKELIMAALSHDLAEHIVGDIPSPTKREMDLSAKFQAYELNKLQSVDLAIYTESLLDGEKQVLQLADMIDGMMFCIKERRLGNQNLGMVFIRFHAYAEQVLREVKENVKAGPYTPHPAVTEAMLNLMSERWKEIV